MSMVAIKKCLRYVFGPDISMLFATARTELTFTAERYGSCITAVTAYVSSKTTFLGAAFEHLFNFMDNVFRELIFV